MMIFGLRRSTPKKHIDSLKLNFTLGEIVSRQAVAICLEGVDRIIKKNNKNVFLCR